MHIGLQALACLTIVAVSVGYQWLVHDRASDGWTHGIILAIIFELVGNYWLWK